MAEDLGLDIKLTGWRRRIIDRRGTIVDKLLSLRPFHTIYWGRGNAERIFSKSRR